MISYKKIVYKLFIVFVVVIFPFLNIAVAQENNTDQIVKADIKNNITILPDSVLNAIKNNCINCKLVTLNDLVDEAREEFLEMHPNANPGWITGDFNGDGLSDHAVLLYNKEKRKIYLRLLVLLATKKGPYVVNTLIKPYEGDFYWYIGLMKSESIIKHTKAYSSKDAPKEIVLKYPSIKYFKAGSYMNVFYFDKGSFRSIPVSY